MSSEVITHRTLPKFIADRAGVALRPGDGIIHSWLNRMLLPDEVGTGPAAFLYLELVRLP